MQLGNPSPTQFTMEKEFGMRPNESRLRLRMMLKHLSLTLIPCAGVHQPSLNYQNAISIPAVGHVLQM